MSLFAVGFTGIDDSVDVDLLRLFGNRHSHSEFGVLFREDKEGQPRYPPMSWVKELAAVAKDSMPPMRLSAHVCGRRCSDILNNGDLEWVRKTLLPLRFKRIQLCATKVNGVEILDADTACAHLRAAIYEFQEVEWIIPASEETRALWEPLANVADPPHNVAILFNASCGQGKVPDSFVAPPSNGIRTGYAGGLGPLTVAAVVQKLRAGVAKGRSIWLDMESDVRATVDGQDTFDIAKAQAVCKALEKECWEQPLEPEIPPPPPPANTKVSTHPLLAHKLTLLRDVSTPPRDFRQLLREITVHLGYEATIGLRVTQRSDVISPVGPVSGNKAVKLTDHVALVPVLRAGLGMVDAMIELLPNAVVHHIGMFRTHGKDAKPIEYYSRLPKDSVADIAFVLEPCIATSKTASAAVSKLKGWGAKKIVVLTVIASHQGLSEMNRVHPDVEVYCAGVDRVLRSDGFIVPGVGDVGDRQFGTPAGNPASKHVYGSIFADKFPKWNAASPLNKPVTLVLGRQSEYLDPSAIPEVELAPACATALTTHDGAYGQEPVVMNWGSQSPEIRGPVLATSRHGMQRNAIGAHSGGYSIYRALAVVSNALDEDYYPKLGMTTPVARIGPFPAWYDPKRIVTMDPLGHAINEAFGPWLEKGYDVRPTIAVTKAHIELPECREALREGRLIADGSVLTAEGQSFVTKAAIEPVWYLPGVAERFGVTEDALRQAIFKETNAMYPELLTRRDLKLFLPPIGGMTVYIWGDPEKIADESVELTCRVHDECNGSDVFGSDICTCRPYLTHAIEECIKTAQRGGTGIVVYFRKEGRALGEVTKYLVYNMRKRQEGGDLATEYFNCTREVAGVTDTRFQVLMPDVLHWLGVTKIHRFISMSDMKHDAIVATGISIVERVEIPPEMVPKDAHVEIAAKVFAGYHAGKSFTASADAKGLAEVKGREYSAATQYEKSVTEGHGAEGKAQGS